MTRDQQHSWAIGVLAVMAAVLILVFGSGCGMPPPTAATAELASARVGGLPTGRTKTSDCARIFVLNPPEMAGEPGIWLQSVPVGSPGDCAMTNHPYPHWTLNGTAEPRFHVFHRPFDVSQSNPDPAGYGNWARIGAAPGTYTITTENGEGDTTSIQVVIQ